MHFEYKENTLQLHSYIVNAVSLLNRYGNEIKPSNQYFHLRVSIAKKKKSL